MRPMLTHSLRVVGRLLWLSAEVVWAILGFICQVSVRRLDHPLEARARWLQRSCRRALRIFGVEVRARGPLPNTGMLVSNHLSYLDILVLSALSPAVFVAKREVKHWPVFGWLAILAGTVFVDRQRRTQVTRTAEKIEAVLQSGALLVLFPEGTSSDGRTVLPFKSSLLQPVIRSSHPVATGMIEYQLEDGDAGEEVCYWKDMTFLPHLLNLLSKQRIQASVQYSEFRKRSPNRKDLAQELHAAVLSLKVPSHDMRAEATA